MPTDTKTAVDDHAKDYWQKYFAEYGESWTKDIPTKVQDTVGKEGRVIPTAYAPTDDGGMIFEGVLAASNEHIAFSARFRKDGKMIRLQQQTL